MAAAPCAPALKPVVAQNVPQVSVYPAKARVAAFHGFQSRSVASFRPSTLSQSLVNRKSTVSLRRGAVNAARAAVQWVLEPVGDGDSSHLGEAVPKPGPISLDGDAFVIGRVSDRSDIVIDIPTVSGSHARLEKKGEEIVVTDLNSTNGTFVDNQRLRPGSPTAVPSGSVVTFGDVHLAQFKIMQKMDVVDV